MSKLIFVKVKGKGEIFCYDGEIGNGFLECRLIPSLDFIEGQRNNEPLFWISKIKHFEVMKEEGYSYIQSGIFQFKQDLSYFCGSSNEYWTDIEFKVSSITELHNIIKIKKLLKI